MLNSGKELSIISDLLMTIVKGFVDAPDKVVFREVMGDQTLVINVSVDKGDIGKVLGKKGSMALALRTILRAVSTKNQVRAVLEIES